MTQIQECVRPSSIPSMSTIYRTTHEALVTISVRRSDPKIARSASRLKLWGAGLFEMAVPLDTVFDSDKDAFRPVRQCTLRILADVLIWAEQELNELSNDGHNTERLHDSQSAKQITALPCTDELLPMALESWKDSVDQHEYIQAGHVFNTNFNPVPGLVEILFDLLPALRAARETYCSRPVQAEILKDNGTNAPAALRRAGRTSDPELARRRPSPVIIQSISSEQPIFDESYVDWANARFDKANDILKKIDKIAKKDGRSSYTPRLQCEGEALGRFHAERRRAKGADTKYLEDLFEKQKQLVRKLDDFIANSSGVLDPGVPLGFLWKRQGRSIKEHTMRVESFLLFLDDTNSAMRDIMHGKGHIVEGPKP